MGSVTIENRENAYFINPILAGEYADPSVVRVGEDYYMTHSCFNHGPGLLVWHSCNLADWEPVGNAVTEYAGNIMAPDLIYHNGLFYIYYPANKTNWVVTAENPAGPWSKPVDLKINRIDPGHVVDYNTGKRYLYISGNYMVPLSDDGLKVVGEPEKRYDGWEIPEEWSVGGFFPESPKLTYREGYYYLTTAQGGTAGPATSHMIVSARAESPFGPWENSPYNPIVHTWSREERWHCKGHGTLVDTPDGHWWIVYHAYEKGYYTLGRQTLMEPVEWTEDGWFRITGVDLETAIKKPEGQIVSGSLELSDSFLGDELNLQWRFYGDRKPFSYWFDHGLHMQCLGNTPEDCSPMLSIPSHHSYEIQVTLELLGEQAEGGLILYYNQNSYYGISLSGGLIYPLRRAQKLAAEEWKDTMVQLKIVNDHHELTMYYGQDGISWHKIIMGMECSGCHHNTLGGFSSVKAGIFAAGSGEVIFRNFNYHPIHGVCYK